MATAEAPVATPIPKPTKGTGDSDAGLPNSDAGATDGSAGGSNSDASALNSDSGASTGTAAASNSDGGAANSDAGTQDSDPGADKGNDKTDSLNNIADTGPAGPANSTNSGDTNGVVKPKPATDQDPLGGINPSESQNVPAFNQSSTTKLPVLPVVTTEGKDINKPGIEPVLEVTVGEAETTESTTLSTTPTTQSTRESTPSTQSTRTAKETTEPIIIEFPNSTKTDPPYAIVTSPTNATLIGPGESELPSKGKAVIAGSIIGVLVLVILVVVLIIWLIRRRKRRSKHEIPVVENPRYNVAPTLTRNSPPSAPHQYRFSRDADISIGEGKKINNNLKPSPMFGKKGMLSYSPAGSGSDLSTGTGSRKKRKAPPPPNPFGNPDYYERDDSDPSKDSGGSDGYEMTTFGNVSTFGKGMAPSPKANNHDEDAKEPLLNGKAGSKEPKRSGDYSSSSSSSSSEDEDEDEGKGEIEKAVDDKFQEHRNSNNYSALNNGDDNNPFNDDDEEEYDQALNPFSESFADTKDSSGKK